jgi:predicted nucleotidyltransferase
MQDLRLVREFKRRAEAALPGRVARVVLFGSRAREDARADSDWDIAVFLRDGASSRDTLTLADAAYDLIVESGQFIQPVAVSDAQAVGDGPLLGSIAREGIEL